MNQFVGYYRVSTKRQGESKLSLDNQKQVVHKFISGELIAEYTEVESASKKISRPELNAAVEFCLANQATLVIAKLDRLIRNYRTLQYLRDSKVKFVFAEMPDANDFTVSVLALVAENESQRISERIRDSHKQRKQRGLKSGHPENFTDAGRAKGRLNRLKKELTKHNNQVALAVIKVLKNKAYSFNAIANYLNQEGYKTARGGSFQAVQVMRLWRMKNQLNQ